MKLQWRLSDATMMLVETLLQRKSVFHFLGSSTHSLAKTIEQIEASGEVMTIPFLLLFSLDAEKSLRKRAAETVTTLLKSLSTNDLLRLDQSVRYMYNWTREDFKKWEEIKPQQLTDFEELSDGAEGLLATASFHRNGFVREAAVYALAKYKTGFELPFLFIRLNDWVPAVRVAARHAVQARMQPEYAPIFAKNIALLEQLSIWERADHSVFLRWILEYLRKPECSSVLDEALNSADTKTRRLIYRLLTRSDNEKVTLFLYRAFLDKDSTIRSWAIGRARKLLPKEEIFPLAKRALTDRYYAVRLNAAYFYGEHLTQESISILKELLSDSAFSVRSIAMYYLRQHSPMDFALFYRSRLDSDSIKDIVGAIQGLGDVGASDDADTIKPLLIHKNHHIRLAVIQALDNLNGDKFIKEFHESIFDTSSTVSKRATRALTKRAVLADQELLWSEYQTQTSVLIKRRLLSVLFETTKWDCLFYTLAVSEASELEIVKMSRHKIDNWINNFNRSSLSPTNRQLEKILSVLEKHASVLSKGVEQSIRFLLT